MFRHDHVVYWIYIQLISAITTHFIKWGHWTTFVPTQYRQEGCCDLRGRNDSFLPFIKTYIKGWRSWNWISWSCWSILHRWNLDIDTGGKQICDKGLHGGLMGRPCCSCFCLFLGDTLGNESTARSINFDGEKREVTYSYSALFSFWRSKFWRLVVRMRRRRWRRWGVTNRWILGLGLCQEAIKKMNIIRRTPWYKVLHSPFSNS